MLPRYYRKYVPRDTMYPTAPTMVFWYVMISARDLIRVLRFPLQEVSDWISLARPSHLDSIHPSAWNRFSKTLSENRQIEQNVGTGQLNQCQPVLGLLCPASPQAATLDQPRDRPLHYPSPRRVNPL